MNLTALRSLGALTLALFFLAACEEKVEPASYRAPITEADPGEVLETEPEPEAEKPAETVSAEMPGKPGFLPPKPKPGNPGGFHDVVKDSFSAWRDLKPGSPPTLHVQGIVQMTSTSMTAELKPREDSDTDLDVVVTASYRIGGATMITGGVKWSRPAKESDAGAVITVHLPNGKTLPLVVEDVH